MVKAARKYSWTIPVFIFVIIASFAVWFIFVRDTRAQTNLISNPSFEEGSGIPVDWFQRNTGANFPVFMYPVPGVNGGRAARVIMNNHSNGDAEWYFKDVPVVPGAGYQFSDSYKSDYITQVTIRYAMTDGTFVYKDIGAPSSARDWTTFQASFIVPANVKSLTIFHAVNANETLDTDNYSLIQVSGPTAGASSTEENTSSTLTTTTTTSSTSVSTSTPRLPNTGGGGSVFNHKN